LQDERVVPGADPFEVTRWIVAGATFPFAVEEHRAFRSASHDNRIHVHGPSGAGFFDLRVKKSRDIGGFLHAQSRERGHSGVGPPAL
jgi:hypothetical protein